MNIVPFRPKPSGRSPKFDTLHRAILEKKQITCTYKGYERHACPHVLGHTNGDEKILVYQFAGGSERGLDPGGQWRCLSVSQIKDLKAISGRWHTGTSHSRPSICVKIVYVDVNTAVPNQPGRR